MRLFLIAILGIVFGLNMSQSGFLSSDAWRDLFLFRNLPLMGILLAANITGICGIYLIRKFKLRSADGRPIVFVDKTKSFYRYALGGLIFGVGWSIAGCPGTTYTLLGHGYASIIVVLIGALSGTLLYTLVRHRLPH